MTNLIIPPARNPEDWEDVNFTSCALVDDYLIAGCNNGQFKVRLAQNTKEISLSDVPR